VLRPAFKRRPEGLEAWSRLQKTLVAMNGVVTPWKVL